MKLRNSRWDWMYYESWPDGTGVTIHYKLWHPLFWANYLYGKVRKLFGMVKE